mgnify:CR=1 FL=1
MDRRNRKMDPTERKITKIAREAGKFTVQAMKEEGIGTAEFDLSIWCAIIRASPRRKCANS